jgi:hypothetical protein
MRMEQGQPWAFIRGALAVQATRSPVGGAASFGVNVKPSWRVLLLVAFLALVICPGPVFANETNPLRPWLEYRTIMWVGDSVWKQPDKAPLFFQRLREMGINTGMVYGDGNPQPLVDNRFPYYLENLVNRGLCLKWNSQVSDWDQHVTDWAKLGRSESAFLRDYCLDDPQWRGWAKAEVQKIIRKNLANQPLACDLRDELSTTISANPFDYDFSPITLARFREWLQTQYPDLGALNAGWETSFSSWDEVKPFSTDQIKARMASGEALPRGKPDWQSLQRVAFDPAEARQQPTRWNFSPWCDFRTSMDISLAGALDDLRLAAHAIDPRTPVGIEGTQMPSAFGGYDLWRLSQVLDWVEPYDIGNAREIISSFMPGKPILTTVFEHETNSARRRLWHLLLEGDRGCIVWWSEDCIDWRSPDYALTPKAKALAPVLKEMASPLAQLFLRAEKEYDPIALYYSQPSIQVDWLLESTADGSTWHRRFSSFEAEHNRMAKVRNAWLKVFQDLGFSPRFVPRFVAGEDRPKLAAGERSVLVLPTVLALSSYEHGYVAGCAASGFLLLADGTPGLFNEHGRLATRNQQEPLFPLARSEERVFAVRRSAGQSAASKDGDIATYSTHRLEVPPKLDWAEWISEQIKGLPKKVTLPLESRTRIHRYTLGAARLLAFERNVDYPMSEELKQAGGNAPLEQAIDLEARLTQSAHIYDLRTQKYLGQTDRISFRLEPWQPSLFALLPEKIAAETVLPALIAEAVKPK